MFTDDELRDLPTIISGPRFATYLRACGNDTASALRLYVWNAEVSAAFIVPLHICEVAVRNGVVEAIERVHGPTGRGPTASSEAYPHRRNPITTIPRSIFGPSQRSSRPPARSSRILTSLSGKRSSPSARTSAFGRRICTPSSPAFPRRSQHRRHERRRFGCSKTFGISATGSHTTNRSSGGNSRMTIRAYGF